MWIGDYVMCCFDSEYFMFGKEDYMLYMNQNDMATQILKTICWK